MDCTDETKSVTSHRIITSGYCNLVSLESSYEKMPAHMKPTTRMWPIPIAYEVGHTVDFKNDTISTVHVYLMEHITGAEILYRLLYFPRHQQNPSLTFQQLVSVAKQAAEAHRILESLCIRATDSGPTNILVQLKVPLMDGLEVCDETWNDDRCFGTIDFSCLPVPNAIARVRLIDLDNAQRHYEDLDILSLSKLQQGSQASSSKMGSSQPAVTKEKPQTPMEKMHLKGVFVRLGSSIGNFTTPYIPSEMAWLELMTWVAESYYCESMGQTYHHEPQSRKLGINPDFVRRVWAKRVDALAKKNLLAYVHPSTTGDGTYASTLGDGTNAVTNRKGVEPFVFTPTFEWLQENKRWPHQKEARHMFGVRITQRYMVWVVAALVSEILVGMDTLHWMMSHKVWHRIGMKSRQGLSAKEKRRFDIAIPIILHSRLPEKPHPHSLLTNPVDATAGATSGYPADSGDGTWHLDGLHFKVKTRGRLQPVHERRIICPPIQATEGNNHTEMEKLEERFPDVSMRCFCPNPLAFPFGVQAHLKLLSQTIERALDPNPHHRHATVDEFCRDFVDKLGALETAIETNGYSTFTPPRFPQWRRWFTFGSNDHHRERADDPLFVSREFDAAASRR
eukprot:GHVU01035116.1.p1 GENE.GHVU01035116.1~~GHVU01035116.1.p1  ORF type:complete len:621 (-),score=49.52 GHVU01035116.1:985-2847(-)